MTRVHRPISGFSLIELAIVLFIVSLLIGGLLMPLSAQNEVRGRQETDKALANIREALIGFAVVNGRLPCPAQASLATAANGAGLEATIAAAGTVNTTGPCGCTLANSGIASAGGTACDDDTPGGVTGVLPWVTLGLPEADAWGNRYTYRMTTRFGRLATGQTTFGACTPASNPATAAFALCSPGDMSVLAATAGTPISSAVPAVIVSHGKNTLGAYMTNGTQISAAAAVADEQANADGNASFVSNTGIDDQIIWIPGSVLMGRMLTAGRLP